MKRKKKGRTKRREIPASVMLRPDYEVRAWIGKKKKKSYKRNLGGEGGDREGKQGYVRRASINRRKKRA